MGMTTTRNRWLQHDNNNLHRDHALTGYEKRPQREHAATFPEYQMGSTVLEAISRYPLG